MKRHSILLFVPFVMSQMAVAQTTLDRVDPSKVERTLPHDRPRQDEAPAIALPAAQRAAPAHEGLVTVGAIYLDGLQALKPSDFADIFETYVGRPLSPEALAGLADAVAERARARGYVFATAAIPPQAISAGMLRVVIDEGRIDAIRLAGEQNAPVRAALAPLAEGRPVQLRELEQRLLIAGDVDGVTLRRTRLVREGDRQLLVVDVARNRIEGLVGLANDGSRPIGPIQADLRVRVSQLLAADDALTLLGVVTPGEPQEFAYGSLRYGKRIDHGGTELFLNGSLSGTEPGAYLEAYDISGRSWTIGAGALQPLLRRRQASLWAEASFNLRRTQQSRAGVRVREDRLSVARLSLYGATAALGGTLRVNLSATQGLDVFDATRRGDPLASRRDADGSFTSFFFWSDWTGKLIPGLEARVAVASQLASDPLLVSEEAGLGGGAFLRAYDYSERTGDRAAMFSAELRHGFDLDKGLVTKPELYVFADGGRVDNLRDGFGSGTLFSAGGGVRFRLTGGIAADAGVAVPLSGPRYDSGDRDPVFNFRISKRF